MYGTYEKRRVVRLYVWATVGRHGAFHLDDLPADNCVLCVPFQEQPAGQLSNYRFSVPPIEGGYTSEPLDLGELVLEGR
jgi:hypothetical protein